MSYIYLLIIRLRELFPIDVQLCLKRERLAQLSLLWSAYECECQLCAPVQSKI